MTLYFHHTRIKSFLTMKDCDKLIKTTRIPIKFSRRSCFSEKKKKIHSRIKLRVGERSFEDVYPLKLEIVYGYPVRGSFESHFSPLRHAYFYRPAKVDEPYEEPQETLAGLFAERAYRNSPTESIHYSRLLIKPRQRRNILKHAST